jgi:Fic-DOC domain mobile mystery protein B
VTEGLAGGATPIDEDEAQDLIPKHVSTRSELDELEEENIREGLIWALRRLTNKSRSDVLSEAFLYELHDRMFGGVWKWGGEVRKTDKNIGVDKSVIRVEVRKLIEDARHWSDNEVFDADELAIRFHHRLVSIHPFPNGNGRHGRMMADLLARKSGRPAFSWGGASLSNTSELRSAYISALRHADEGDFVPLLKFARS